MAGARRTSRRRYVLLVIVLTCLTLITLDSRNGRSGPFGTLGGLAHRVVAPLENGVDDIAAPVSDWWHGVTDAGRLKRENRRLEEQVAALQGKQTAANQALAENSDFKRTLKLIDRLLVKNVTATIIGRGAGNFAPTLTIDKGSEAGIAVDMPVVAPEGIVGKVIQAWRGGAVIQVLTDPEFSVGVQTPGHPGAPPTTGIASGQDQQHVLTVQFDAGTKIARGDSIVTSPQSTLFPSGFPVGTITTTTDEPGNVGVSATITPYVHLGALQHLTVLLWTTGTPGPALATTTTSTSTTTSTTLGFGVTTTTAAHG